MAINSRRKGVVAERELAHELQKFGFEARRGCQFCGKNGDADVVGIPGVHIECKRVQQLNIHDAMRQSVRDARPGELPIVAHRKNYEHWLVTMRLEDFISLLKEMEE